MTDMAIVESRGV